jgi:hypothetical protein
MTWQIEYNFGKINGFFQTLASNWTGWKQFFGDDCFGDFNTNHTITPFLELDRKT